MIGLACYTYPDDKYPSLHIAIVFSVTYITVVFCSHMYFPSLHSSN